MRVIVAGCLNLLNEAHGAVRCLLFPGGMGIFGKRINGERLAIDAFLCVHWRALVIQHPVDAAKLAVPEMTAEIFVCATGGSEVHGVLIDAERLGKRPKNSCIQDEPFVCMRIDCQVVRNLAAKAAVLLINGALEPEGQDAGK